MQAVRLPQLFPVAVSAFAFAAFTPCIAQQTDSPKVAGASAPRVAPNFDRTPLSFEANRGQAAQDVQFLSRSRGYTVLLRGGGADLAFVEPVPAGKTAAGVNPHFAAAFPAAGLHAAHISIQLSGANPQAAAAEEEPQITRTNYFIGDDPDQWKTNIPNYGRIRYRAIYPGVDLVYYGNQRRLEHDFVVAPGAAPQQIQLAFAGTRQIKIDPATGDLVLRAGKSELRLLKPVTYQESAGKRTPVIASYKLLASNRAAFSIGSYDRSKPLVIDPVLVYSTYLGGAAPFSGGNNDILGDPEDGITGIAADSAGNAYVAGFTYSEAFPVTSGVYQASDTGLVPSAFVAKLDPTGNNLVYATYLGGKGENNATAIAIDASGNAYVTGLTSAKNFPTTPGAFQIVSKEKARAAFVTKLNASGSALVYSTYLAGSGGSYPESLGEYAYGIALNSAGDAYVAGSTTSTDFPVTQGAFDTKFKPVYGGADQNGSPLTGFLTRLNAAGTKLLYSTYLGGSFQDSIYGLAVDSSGEAYVTGITTSVDFPVTPGTLQTGAGFSKNGYGYEGFVTRINAEGSSLVYSTYFPAIARGIAADSSGDAYFAGWVTPDQLVKPFPTTAGAFQTKTTQVDWSTGFVSKLNPTGSKLLYSTYLGGSKGQGDSVSTIAIDSSGNAYVAGASATTDFPITANAFQSGSYLSTLPFFTELNSSGSGLVYSTYFGGSTASATGVALDGSGSVYLAGSVFGNNFPISPGALQTTRQVSNPNDERNTGFVAKLDVTSALAGAPTATTLTVNGGQAAVNILPVALSVVVAGRGAGPSPTGNVDFRIDGQIVATVALSASGKASYTSPALSQYLHTIAANYEGDSNYAPSAGDAALEVQIPTMAATAGAKQNSTYGVPFATELAIQLQGPTGNIAAAGVPITFSGAGLKFSSQTVTTDSTGKARVIAIPTQSGTLTAIASVPVGTPNVFSVSFPNLFAHKAELLISPARIATTYGQAVPAPTAFTVLKGLVNGDTQTTAVTGAPVMTTAATSASPVGIYPIKISTGTLASANYSFQLWPGEVQVYPADLTTTANSFTIQHGQPIPALTYSFSGFVNGDTQSVVSGAPILSTTATSSSPPGTYPILIRRGTLSAANYVFPVVNGTLTIQ
jgi:hypothetical protein